MLDEFLRNPRIFGGGGTSHIPVFEYIARHHLEPDLFIGITDLRSVFPEKKPHYPVLWVAPRFATYMDWCMEIEDVCPPPPWGHVIRIEPYTVTAAGF